MLRKLNLYRDARVRKYWVVDLERQRIEVYHLQDGGYMLETFRAGDTVHSEALPGLAIPLNTIFA
jgi:Uma2 family endonuclease